MPRIHIRGVSEETIETLHQIRDESGASIGEIVDYCIAASEDEARQHFEQQDQDGEAAREKLLQLISELRLLLADSASALRILSESTGTALPGFPCKVGQT